VMEMVEPSRYRGIMTGAYSGPCRQNLSSCVQTLKEALLALINKMIYSYIET